MLETLISVGVGGLIGVAGTIATNVMQTRRARELQRRKEVLPVAARALAAAQEAWIAARKYQDNTVGLSQKFSLMEQNDQARNQLLLALDELSLLIPDIEDEIVDLLGSVGIKTEVMAKDHEQQLDDYLDASKALQQRIRAVLKTNKDNKK